MELAPTRELAMTIVYSRVICGCICRCKDANRRIARLEER